MQWCDDMCMMSVCVCTGGGACTGLSPMGRLCVAWISSVRGNPHPHLGGGVGPLLSVPYMLRPGRDTRSFASLAHPPFTNSSITNPRCPWPALLLIATTSTALRRRQHQHQQRPRCSTRSPPRPRGAASFVSQSVKGPASYLKYGMTSVTGLD